MLPRGSPARGPVARQMRRHFLRPVASLTALLALFHLEEQRSFSLVSKNRGRSLSSRGILSSRRREVLVFGQTPFRTQITIRRSVTFGRMKRINFDWCQTAATEDVVRGYSHGDRMLPRGSPARGPVARQMRRHFLRPVASLTRLRSLSSRRTEVTLFRLLE